MNLNENKPSVKILNSNSGFIVADFLFSFVLVIGIGIVIFALTFSLATIEIAQYIIWSTARNFAAANVDEATAKTQATAKFNNLSQQFPLLTGQGQSGSAWFTLDGLLIGDLAKVDQDFIGKVPGGDLVNVDNANEARQPWIGASAVISLKLFSSINIPFLGKVAKDPAAFKFPVRAFILRSPSTEECKNFYKYEERFVNGIKKIPTFSAMTTGNNMVATPTQAQESSSYVPQEDNGC